MVTYTRTTWLKLKKRKEKYENKFAKNYLSKSLNTFLFASRRVDEVQTDKYNNKKQSISDNKRNRLKWKTIKWLMDNKKQAIDKLLKTSQILITLSSKKDKEFKRGLNKEEFASLIVSNGISNDMDLISKLFWLFDEDMSGDLQYSELVFGFEMFSNSSIERKLRAFFDLCDIDGSGTISKKEFVLLLKKNIINKEERETIDNVVDTIFDEVKLNKDGEITLLLSNQ